MQTHRNWAPRENNKMQSSTLSSSSLSASEKLSIMEALDHIYVTRQYQEIGSCSVCKKISLKKCSGCGIFYCSSECQTFDWPKHREKCSKHRDSVSDRTGFSSSKQMKVFSSPRNFKEDEKMMPVITNRGSPFTALANQLSKKSGRVNNENKGFANFKIGNGLYRNGEFQGKDIISGLQEYKKISSSDRNKKSPTKVSSKASSQGDKSSIKSQTSSATLLRNDSAGTQIALENTSSSCVSTLSRKSSLNSQKIGKMKVIGTYRESEDRYWVMGLCNLEKYEEIQDTLNKECKNYESTQPNVGLVCGCTYGDEWFRGKIMAVTPEISVHFMDYGNTSNYNLKLFKKLPYNLRSLPPLAFLIEFEEGTPSEYRKADLESENFTIEEIAKTPDGAVRVKVIEGPYGLTEDPTKIEGEKETEEVASATNRSAIDDLTATSTGMLFFIPGEGSTRFASLVPDNHKDASHCIENVLNIDKPRSTPFEADEGDYVLVTDKDGSEQRGKVISKFGSSYRVQLVDCGNVISAAAVYPLPEHLKGLIELGVKVTLKESLLQENMTLETCFFVVNGAATSGKWPCTLINTEQQPVARILLEKPVVGVESQPGVVHLKSGSTVEISHICSPNSLYVRPVDAEMEQKLLDMNMEIIQFAPKAKHLPIPPPLGTLCCARFEEDSCYYRAKVTSVQNGKVQILFVDFGNEQETDLKDVKPLPDYLKKVPFLSVKVTLKNVSPKSWNNMIKEYIKKLDSENIELTLTYTESIKNGVVLREKVSGVVVNDFIEKAKNKEVNSALSKKKEIFLDDDLKYTTPPVGGVCALALLYIEEGEFETSQTFWATVAEVDNFNYVNAELSSLMSKHCASVSTPYRPVYRELCLAEYEGSWYRAMCAGQEGDIFRVFFVDFGNACELKSESIREMKEEFVEAPALAMHCILNGRERLKGKPEMVKQIYDLLLNKINTCIKGVTITHFQDDTFLLKIPEIEAILSG